MSAINLLLCFDRPHLEAALISTYSFITRSGLRFQPIFACDETVTGDHLEVARHVLPNLAVIRLSRNAIEQEMLAWEGGKASNPIGTAAFYRIYAIQQLADSQPTLYVDTDTICVRRLEHLPHYLQRLRDNPHHLIAACSHMTPGYRQEQQDVLKLDSPYRYINSGVMLFFPQTARRAINPESISHVRRQYPSAWRKTADQGPINMVAKGRILYMDHTYNMMTWHFLEAHRYYQPENNVLVDLLALSPSRASADARIIHYTTHPKPWVLSAGERQAHPNRSFPRYTEAEEAFRARFPSIPERLEHLNRAAG
jgi:lipopolysaccharide biosynthesis glycosyltransferase